MDLLLFYPSMLKSRVSGLRFGSTSIISCNGILFGGGEGGC